MDPPELERWLALSSGGGPGAAARSAPDPAVGPFGPAYGITDRTVFRQRYPHLDADDDLLDHTVLDPDDALAAASWLDRCLNNTSLVFVVEVEDVRIVFPGDAQWGVWREILANTDARALLERATLYKVSHHGSHNGSPKSLVHDVLPEHVTSMMSFRTMERWTAIPADRPGGRAADAGPDAAATRRGDPGGRSRGSGRDPSGRRRVVDRDRSG